MDDARAQNTGPANDTLFRDLPGWEHAPVPLCLGGDARALTFCCKPGHPLMFADACRRDAVLARIGLSQREFVRIKDSFSQEQGWECDQVCFGSLAYCCIRRRGCPAGRDAVLDELYGENAPMKEYFARKRELAGLLLRSAARNEGIEHLLTL